MAKKKIGTDLSDIHKAAKRAKEGLWKETMDNWEKSVKEEKIKRRIMRKNKKRETASDKEKKMKKDY